MKLSEHFTLDEFTFSELATRHNIKNEPTATEVSNMAALCQNCLEEIRYGLNAVKGKEIPISIISGFRNKETNRLANGAKRSQHLKGQAADIRAKGIPPQELYSIIRKLISQNKFIVDQLILEFNSWVHISYDLEKEFQRKDFLIASKDKNGSTIYTKDIALV